MTTASTERRTDPRPNAALSVAFGVGAGLLIGFLGPLYGGLVVILSFALVFRAASRVDLRWLFLGFTPVWILLLVLGTNATTSVLPGNQLALGAMGFVPVALSAGTVLLVRARAAPRSHDF